MNNSTKPFNNLNKFNTINKGAIPYNYTLKLWVGAAR